MKKTFYYLSTTGLILGSIYFTIPSKAEISNTGINRDAKFVHCSTVPGWNSTTAYTTGATVVYNNHLWRARWWNQGEIPGSAAGAWQDLGQCTS